MKIFNLIFYFLYFFVFGQNYLLAQGIGTYHQYDLNVDGQNRQYTLYEPLGYDGTEALPIVFLFHGFSVPIELQIEISRMYEVADTANFFIVYPQGLEVEDAVFGGFGTGWNLPKSYKGEQDDVAFVNAMIDDLIANPAFKINPSRVHATGFSNGGEMSYLLGCTLSDRIASVASVANPMTDTMVNEICVPSKQIATMHIQGTADFFFAEAGIPPFLPLEASAQFWANKNGCDITPTITMLNDINAADNSTVSLLSYENCDANFEVKTYKITNGGHSWPGGWLPEELSFLGSVNQDFNASVEIWNFFKRNPSTSGRLLERTYYYPDSLRTPGTLASFLPFSDSIREYLLYVPAAYDGSEKWPLVINMHGYALSPEFQVEYSNMNAVADTAHFLVAYPKGTTIISTAPNTPPQGLGFNVSGEGDSSFVSPTNENEVFFIENMIYQISEDFKIDQARIYATGFSNGGMMATVLASELPSLIAAAASVGGAPPISRPIRPFGPDRPTPVLYIHGTADSIVPYLGSELTTSLPEVLETWAKENGCDDAVPLLTSLPDIDPNDGSIVQSLSWQNCDAETQHLLIVDGGHQWPGGNNLLPFLGNFNNDINASSEIWNFFKRNPHPNPSGKILLKTMKPDSILREYLLYVPAAYDGSEDWPLVLNIHGYRWSADFQMFFSNMNPVADTAHFLIACPQGTQIISNIPNLRPGGGFGFNIVGEGDSGYVSPSNVNDVEFMSKLIDRISEDYRVAQDQVYSTGFSNGGMLSTILGSELENKIAAIAPVGGTIPKSRPFEPQRPMPVLYINGTSDRFAFYENDVFLRGVPEVLETWATTNGCDAEPVVTAVPDIETSDSSTVELLEWKNCDAEVLHFKVLGGGHQWPGGNNYAPFLGNFNLDINASSEIWNFFSRNRHPSPAQSQLLEKTIIVDSLEREYLLYVPAAYDGSENWPLVINYHGFNNTAEDQVFVSQMNAVADTAGFLIAYPQGLLIENPFLGFTAPGWNIDGTLSQNDDFEFTSKLIEQISADYAIDQSRIHATGWSLGSGMSFQVACSFPNQIASVAGVANPMADIQFEFCQLNRPYSTLLIHGTADPIVPFEGDGVLFSNTSNTPAFWAAQNNCDLTPEVIEIEDSVSSDSSTVTLFKYSNCDNDTEVLFYQINNGGHSWPGGGALPSFLGNVNRDINASSEIWNFFNRQRLPQATARVQFIHAASYETVDVFANGALLLDNFAWRTATPFLDVPADTPLAIELVPSNALSTTPTVNLDLEFKSGGTYVVAVNGTFDQNDPWPVEATVRDNAVEQANDPNKLAFSFFQGVPDFGVPTFDIIVEGEEGVLWDNAGYKSFFDYQDVQPGPVVYISTPADDNTSFFLGFLVDLAFWKGKSAVQFNTGLSSTWTEPWIALSNGGTFPLRRPTANQPLIQNQDHVYQLEVSPNPASHVVNIRFDLKAESPVLLDLFDNQGKFVKNIQVGILSEGTHRFDMEVAGLSKGMYILSLKTSSGEQTRTLMIADK